MKCLRINTGERRFDRMRDKLRDMCGNQHNLLEWADQEVPKWFCHIERMEGERIINRIYRARVERDNQERNEEMRLKKN